MNAMTMRMVRGAGGVMIHVPAPMSIAQRKASRKVRTAPDPIRTNGDSAAEQLRLLIERVERMDEEIKAAQDDRRDILAEAKGRGYDPKALLAIVARRRKDRAVLQEEEAILETYLQALGMV